ncbi:MAG: arginase family protein [Candidatus Eisenbacteria bacterium]|nr:arginase family protein [Candidatus Eisenbacteria bacterium]MCC7140784.1 arginase family protein [Candidatus Eisenbacteria bacterium]
MPSRQIAILDAPSNLGLRPPAPGREPGVRHLASALRQERLGERLGSQDRGRAIPPDYSPEPDLAVGFRNGTSLARYTGELASRIEPILAAGEFPLVLGGDCSILLGAALALRRRGRYGLAFIDGHDDYSLIREPAKYPGVLAGAGLDLALVTGHGPDVLSNREGLGPYIREDDVVQIGLSRTAEDATWYSTETFDQSEILTCPQEQIRSVGGRAAAAIARSRLEETATLGYWIHLDVDVLDQTVMPAVDSPNECGLRLDELEEILAGLLASRRVAGMNLSIFDPELDPDRRLATLLVDLLVRVLRAPR